MLNYSLYHWGSSSKADGENKPNSLKNTERVFEENFEVFPSNAQIDAHKVITS